MHVRIGVALTKVL